MADKTENTGQQISTEVVLFEEKQFFGQNRFGLIRRMVLAIFCFVAYYWSENPEPAVVSGIHTPSYPIDNIPNSGLLFFILGMVILVLSAIMLFIRHLKTTVTQNSVILDGFWAARKVKINFDSIVSVKKIPYSRFYFNPPVYNLHVKGRIRFYTGGRDAVELIDRDGLKFIIGTQKQKELSEILSGIDKAKDK